VLARSGYTGPPVRLQTNREVLARAIRLGFAEVEVVDADTPLVSRDEHRVLAWQPLAKDSAIGPDDDATRIVSGVQSSSTSPGEPSKPRSEPTRRVDRQPSNPPTSAAEPTGSGLAARSREAESLHETLGAARTRAGRLVVALRKQRRRERLVAATLASLRQLRLQDVAD
jgi:hypothetical protein